MRCNRRGQNNKVEISYNYGINAVLNTLPDSLYKSLYETARIRTNTNSFFVEELTSSYNNILDLFKQELRQRNCHIKFFDRQICLVKAMLDKDFITTYNVCEKSVEDINEKVVLETVLAFMSFSKWCIKGNEAVQLDLLELYKNHENVLESYKKQLLESIKHKDYDGISYILKTIYLDGIASFYGLNQEDKSKVLKNVKILVSNVSTMEVSKINAYSKQKNQFRKSYLRNSPFPKPIPKQQNQDYN